MKDDAVGGQRVAVGTDQGFPGRRAIDVVGEHDAVVDGEWIRRPGRIRSSPALKRRCSSMKASAAAPAPMITMRAWAA